MKIKEFCYSYAVENITDGKAVAVEIEKLEGVVSASVSKGRLIYEISEWTDEYDILTASMTICENYGGELIVDDVAELKAVEENASEKQTETDELLEENADNRVIGEDLSADGENSQVENLSDKPENEKIGSFLGDEVEETESLEEMRKKLKTSTVTRAVELGIALVCIILGFAVPNSNSGVFNFSVLIMILGFAISIYEVIFIAFKSIMKKRFNDFSITVTVASIGMILFNLLEPASLIAFLFAVYSAVTLYTRRKRTLNYAEKLSENASEKQAISDAVSINDEFLTKAKKKGIVFDVFGYVGLAVCVLTLFCLIPALNLINYVGCFFAVGLILASFKFDFFSDCKFNALSSAKLASIDFADDLALAKVAKVNAFEIEASALIDENGNLKQDAIGAMKESVLLGIKSLKTNFNVEVSDEIKSQIDFNDKEFKGKNVLTIGNGDCNVNYALEEDACESGKTKICSDRLAKIPFCYSLAKKAVKGKIASAIISHLTLPLAVVSIILTVLEMTAVSSWLAVGAVALIAVSGLISLGCFAKEN